MSAKVFFSYNGVDYDNYDFYCETMDRNEYVLIERNRAAQLLEQPGIFVPQKGMKAYIIPGCTRAISDIRKDYIVKRKPEDADFIVSSKSVKDYSWSSCFDEIMIVPSKNAFFAFEKHAWNRKLSLLEFMRAIFPDIDHVLATDPGVLDIKDPRYDISFLNFRYLDISTQIDHALGKIQKPMVHIDNLPIYSSNSLDIETLQMVYKIGMTEYSDNNKDNFIVQLQALNQTEWRNYKGTLHLLYSILRRNPSTASNVLGKASALPKSVKEMVQSMWKSYKYESQEDLDLGHAFLQTIVQFDTNQFYDIETLTNKFRDARVDFTNFYHMYDNIVKIRPKCIR